MFCVTAVHANLFGYGIINLLEVEVSDFPFSFGTKESGHWRESGGSKKKRAKFNISRTVLDMTHGHDCLP